MGLPSNVKLVISLWTKMLLNIVPGGKSLFTVTLPPMGGPWNVRSSPGMGATPPFQLAGLVMLLSPPAPVQKAVPPCATGQRKTTALTANAIVLAVLPRRLDIDVNMVFFPM